MRLLAAPRPGWAARTSRLWRFRGKPLHLIGGDFKATQLGLTGSCCSGDRRRPACEVLTQLGARPHLAHSGIPSRYDDNVCLVLAKAASTKPGVSACVLDTLVMSCVRCVAARLGFRWPGKA